MILITVEQCSMCGGSPMYAVAVEKGDRRETQGPYEPFAAVAAARDLHRALRVVTDDPIHAFGYVPPL